MSWGLGWKRPLEIFRLTLNYGTEGFHDDLSRTQSSSSVSSSSSSSSSSSPPAQQPQALDQRELGFRIELDWTSGDDEEQVALRLQSQLMVALPLPQDAVAVELKEKEGNAVEVEMMVEKRREPLRGVIVAKAAGSGQQCDGIGVFTRLLRSNLVPSGAAGEGGVAGCGEHWRTVTMLSLCGCGLTVSFVFVFLFILFLVMGFYSIIRQSLAFSCPLHPCISLLSAYFNCKKRERNQHFCC